MTTAETTMAERFAKDTDGHGMSVLLDQGPYRHLMFRKNDLSQYWFEIITWPGHLTVNGDMGTYTFARLADMFQFFRKESINPSYWEEKIRAGNDVRTYSEAAVARHALEVAEDYESEYPGLTDAVQSWLRSTNISDENDARHELDRFHFVCSENGHTTGEFRFYDTWEWQLSDFAPRFLWNCHAIAWAIAQYDAS